jgi:hypothetical protein
MKGIWMFGNAGQSVFLKGLIFFNEKLNIFLHVLDCF